MADDALFIGWGEVVRGREEKAVEVEGDLDLRGTLGVDKSVGAGFARIRVRFDVDAPEATPDQLAALLDKTERYCTVLQTLVSAPAIETRMGSSATEQAR
jgi:uncharacterized OsmC-like protein